MEYTRIIKSSADIVIRNIIPYGIATLIFTFGSMLVITGPPLLYGFISMLIKGKEQEETKISDVFVGFRSRNFIRSWIFALFMFAVLAVITIAWIILYVITGAFLIILVRIFAITMPEMLAIGLLAIISIALLFLVALPAILIVYVLPLFVIKEYSVTDAISESIVMVKDHLIESTLICTIVGLIALAGVLPYYTGLFLQLPFTVNMVIYFAGIILTTPLSQQILVNATMELMD